ncbi:hypothetical protein ACLOJK_022175 [Asimina triloba]
MARRSDDDVVAIGRDECRRSMLCFFVDAGEDLIGGKQWLLLPCLRETLTVGVFLVAGSAGTAGGFGLQMPRSDGDGFSLLRTLMQRWSSVRHRRLQPPTITDLCRLHGL